MTKKRIDQLLVEKKLVRSRHQASELIKRGSVKVRGVIISKPSTEFDENISSDEFLIIESEITQFVSRGGAKLYNALQKTKLEVVGKTVFDIGVSTGGFSDCLLQQGASKVIGVDVGSGQLAEKLKTNENFILLEGINARGLAESDLESVNAPKRCDILVADVSFISLEQVFPQIISFLRPGGHILALVKPQFEAGREWLSKGGIIKNEEAFKFVEQKIRNLCQGLQLKVLDYFESAPAGTDGNKEFFVFVHKPE